MKRYTPLIMIVALIILIFDVNYSPKKVLASAGPLTFKGKIFSLETKEPLKDLTILIDNDLNSSFDSLTNVKRTVTGSDGSFNMQVPTRDYSQLYISSASQTEPNKFYDLRGFISWSNDMVTTWQSDSIEANILLKPGYGLEYVHIVPLATGWNHIATPINPTGSSLEDVLKTVVIENNLPTEVSLNINNRLRRSSGPNAYTTYRGTATASSFGPIKRNVGYWYDSPIKATLVLKGEFDKSTPLLSLWQGNNLIANPWGIDYSVKNLQIVDNEVVKTYSQALQENLIDYVLETYNPLVGYPQGTGVPKNPNLVMKVGRCYWLNVKKENLEIIIPSPYPPSDLAEVNLPSTISPADIDKISNLDFTKLKEEEKIYLSTKLGEFQPAKVDYIRNHYVNPPKDLEITYLLNNKPLIPTEVIDPSEGQTNLGIIGSRRIASRQIAMGTPPIVSGNLKIYFVPIDTKGQPQWTVEEKSLLSDFRDSSSFQTILAKIIEIGGPFLVTPKDLERGQIDIAITKIWSGDQLSPATYDNLNGKRLISTSYAISELSDLKNGGTYAFLEELVHSMKVRNVKDSRVEEGRANATLQLAYKQLGIAFPSNNYLPWYEQRNREVISPQTTSTTILSDQTNLTSEDRYALAAAAFEKIYYEDNLAFTRYIKNLAAKNNTIILPSGYKELKQAVKTVERQNLDDWLDRQYGLGYHTYAYSLFDYTYVELTDVHDNIKYRVEHDFATSYLNNHFKSADGRYRLQGYKTYFEGGASVTKEFISDTGTLNTAYTLPDPDLASQRYVRFTWMETVHDLNPDSVRQVILSNPNFRIKPPWSTNIAYSGIARPFLWGIVDHGHSGRIEIAPVNPSTGALKAVFKIVPFQNGVFDSNDPVYGQKAGTYEIRYYADGCNTPIKRIITKPEGEYYVFIETKGRKFPYLASVPQTSMSNWQKLSKLINNHFGSRAEAYGYCDIAFPPAVEHLEKTLTDTKLSINFDTVSDTGGYLKYTKDNGTDAYVDFNEININHGMDISDLTDGKTYPYQVVALTPLNQINIKEDDTFTIFSLTDIKTNPQETTATITWNTSVETKGMVEYGLDTNYGQIIGEPEGTNSKTHSLTIEGLIPNTTYHFRIKAIGP